MSPTAHIRHTSRGSSDWNSIQSTLCGSSDIERGSEGDLLPTEGRHPSSFVATPHKAVPVALISLKDRQVQSPDISILSTQSHHDGSSVPQCSFLRSKRAAGVAFVVIVAAAWLDASVLTNPVHGYTTWDNDRDIVASVDPIDFETNGPRNGPAHLERHHIFLGRNALVAGDWLPSTSMFVLGELFDPVPDRRIDMYPAEYSDVTQTYPVADSADPPASESMEMRKFPTHEFDEDCVPMASWQTTFYPTCNAFHERDLPDDLLEALSLISSKGHWRSAWELRDWAQNGWQGGGIDHEVSVVIKMLQYEHNMEDAFFEFNRVDALAMERLTPSPYVMDIYGFCGMSVATSFAGEDIAKLSDKLTPLERLNLAREVAVGLADIHGIDGGGRRVSLVHNDINYSNILISKERRVPVFNDFNIAVLSMWNERTNDACRFKSHFPNPQWRSPEEQVDMNGESNKRLTEKIDVYALGNVFFRFIAGTGPWKKTQWRQDGKLTQADKDKIALLKMEEGGTPPLPAGVKELKEKDPAVNALFQAMRMCYRHDPRERPSARDIVEYLDAEIRKVARVGSIS